MKERGIIFKDEMVRALLDGRKTQTRSFVKPPRKWKDQFPYCDPHAVSDPYAVWWWNGIHMHYGVLQECPFGKVGDLIWVRESWRAEACLDHVPTRALFPPNFRHFEADGKPHPDAGRLRSSIHMPRWASRITLEIIHVRVERLNNISDDDCFAEGIIRDGSIAMLDMNGGQCYGVPKAVYQTLWESINGKESWNIDAWVWVIEFRRIK